MSVTLKRKRQDGDDSQEIPAKRAHNLSKGANTSENVQIASTSNGTVASTLPQTEQNVAPVPNQGINATNETKKQKEREKKLPGLRNIPTKAPLKRKPKIKKLAPQRPYPTVPTSSNATGPKSKRKEGNNKICITRRMELGAYLSQCRDLFVKQGYTEVYLAAMGAAIPHAVMLATSLPEVLPFDKKEIQTNVTTGSANVMDEVIPEDEDDEGGVQTRIKATIEIIIRVVPLTGMSLNEPKQKQEETSEDSFSD
ncbi:hypothetical protein FRC18_001202 [Serendipita sp. 400]|nr:hypothetical protein FRC18_001202 [Serendipita sp. 400]